MATTGPRKPQKALTAQAVKAAREPGKYFDGNGLYLLVRKNGSQAWVQRIVIQGKRSELGLGSPILVPLSAARDTALANRRIAVAGGDPKKKDAPKEPGLTLSQALAAYWTLASDKAQGKSDDQIRRWKNPRIKAFKNLIAVVGDEALENLGPNDFLDFRSWWWDKITAEDLTPNSANKDFTHIGSTFQLVCKAKRIAVPQGLDGLNFSQGEKRTRLPFSEAWIKDKLLAPGALDGLNKEARCILLGMINTGYRPSEGQSLKAEHIHLDGPFPHITIEPDGRTLKNASSRRIIPLAGCSLAAFKECPDGFPRYFASAGLSATLNKFMRENGLMESPQHTLYGLRHSFEDRMLDRDVDERIRRDLMGHSLSRERYGKGASMEKLAGVVRSIAL